MTLGKIEFLNNEGIEYLINKNNRDIEALKRANIILEAELKKRHKKSEPKPEDRGELVRNAFRCKKCGMVVESKSVHDYQKCKCGNFTDGGLDYIRRGGNDEDMEDLCEWEGPIGGGK